jgi:AcrR family transcriptional regulator
MSELKMKNHTRARREEDKGKRREVILDAAEKVIAKLGLKGANFGAVAKQSRLSRSLIYVYFPKRSDLIHAVCQRGLSVLQTRFAEVAAQQEKGIEQVIAMVRAYQTFSKDEPLYFSVIAALETYTIPVAEENEIEHKLTDCAKQVIGLVAMAVKKGQDDHSISLDCGDPVLTALSIWAFAHGVIQVSTSKEFMLKDDLGVFAVDMIEHGLCLLRRSLALGKRK